MKVKTKVGADIKGRINKCELPIEKSLLPLYETITNSINAIENADINPDKGLITIINFIKRNLFYVFTTS